MWRAMVYCVTLRGWLVSLDRDRDGYSIMDWVKDAHAFLNKPPVERRPQFVSLSSHPPNKPSVKWPVNNDNDLIKMFDKWKGRKRISLPPPCPPKADFIKTQVRAKPQGKDVRVNARMGKVKMRMRMMMSLKNESMGMNSCKLQTLSTPQRITIRVGGDRRWGTIYTYDDNWSPKLISRVVETSKIFVYRISSHNILQTLSTPQRIAMRVGGNRRWGAIYTYDDNWSPKLISRVVETSKRFFTQYVKESKCLTIVSLRWLNKLEYACIFYQEEQVIKKQRKDLNTL
ncbi:hypothetical protein Cgig2_027537 [Carnegiea gigantea]|uniref:Uncharacterized protein n=1 Tax=Carnegiea gigantea TaxID=171969 RepID=A0A9Q1GRG9_9CARY|nr:hypothetical protein Cgig2_027537 [Carnegiea gigantea]